MKRTLLIVVASVFALACAAQFARARGRPAPRGALVETNAPRFPPVPSPTASRKIDEYGNIRWGDERARLDNFAIELQNDPTAVGRLTCYGGRRGRAGEAARRCARAKGYVSNVRGIEAERVVTVDGGFREDLTVRLVIVPRGAQPPEPSPTVEPGEVVIIKRAAGRRPRRR